jgi:regulator of protease activity HflC (stomatin/prohibitin superfamily)
MEVDATYLLPVAASLCIAVAALFACVKRIGEHEHAVVLRMGRISSDAPGPTIVYLLPLLDRMVRVETRSQRAEVFLQYVPTLDDHQVALEGVVSYRVTDPREAVTRLGDFRLATRRLLGSTLRRIALQTTLDTLISDAPAVNAGAREAMKRATALWGLEVLGVEVRALRPAG